MIMVHGDDKGLVIPPRLAKNKAVIVNIVFSENKEENQRVNNECEKLLKSINDDNLNVLLDDRDN